MKRALFWRMTSGELLLEVSMTLTAMTSGCKTEFSVGLLGVLHITNVPRLFRPHINSPLERCSSSVFVGFVLLPCDLRGIYPCTLEKYLVMSLE